MVMEEIQRYSHFDYYVQSRACGDCWRPEKRFYTKEDALAYLAEWGKENYKGEYHGKEMRAVEVEELNITRKIKDNREQ